MLITDLFEQQMFESLSRVIPYTWKDHSTDDLKLIQADFQIQDGYFIVQFNSPYYNPGYWNLSFTRNGELELTGTGSATTVLATVIAIVREFIHDVSPRHISFAAKNDEMSRNKLYPILFAKIAKEFTQYTTGETKKLRQYTSYNASQKASPEKFVAKRYEEPKMDKPINPTTTKRLNDILDDDELMRQLMAD